MDSYTECSGVECVISTEKLVLVLVNTIFKSNDIYYMFNRYGSNYCCFNRHILSKSKNVHTKGINLLKRGVVTSEKKENSMHSYNNIFCCSFWGKNALSPIEFK